MERLTERFGNGIINVKYASQHETAIHRLVAIEDILGDEYDLDRLRELAQADREGRCVVLPCKVGDTVYQVDDIRVYALEVRNLIYDAGILAFDESTIGKTVFLTRAEAEAALHGEQEEKQ